MSRVLLIQASEAITYSICDILRQEGYHVNVLGAALHDTDSTLESRATSYDTLESIRLVRRECTMREEILLISFPI